MWSLLAAAALAAAVTLAVPSAFVGTPPARRPAAGRDGAGGLARWRPAFALLAGAGGATLVPPPLHVVAALALGGAVWVTLGRSEPAAVRRARELAIAELPDVVQLLAMALASGASVSTAIRQVHQARPGPATELLAAADRRLVLGVPWGEAWPELDPGFARLGRTLARSSRSGAPVAQSVAQLARELADARRAAAADRARTVGVRAALPLGVCLLPAFLLIGIVPVVVASVQGLPW